MEFSLGLHHGQTQSLKQNQRLMMSPQMRQAIHLLQVPSLELASIIEAEIEQNPVMEYLLEEDLREKGSDADNREYSDNGEAAADTEMEFDGDDFAVLRQLGEEFNDHFAQSGNVASRTQEEEKLKAFVESSIQSQESLFEHLMHQAEETFSTPEELACAEVLIGNLDERGFLTISLEEISLLNSLDLEQLEEVLATIKTFEPPGVGAANEQQCLLLQLAYHKKQDTLAYQIVTACYDDLLHNRIPLIKKKLSCSAEEIQMAIDIDIAKLDIRPGTEYSQQLVPYVIPDVIVDLDEDELVVRINETTMPPIRLNNKYLKMLESDTVPDETKDYIRRKVSSCKWLLKNIHQRNETLLKIAQILLERQKAFFSDPQGKLTPLTMKVVAEELQLHESTIARAVANKYISCPRGVMTLKFFFTTAYTSTSGDTVSSRTVEDFLQEIINQEDKTKPYSDETISELLEERGINCARRTVAKYRRKLNIGTASQRKRY